jgi:uncharacterized membrane protein YadS
MNAVVAEWRTIGKEPGPALPGLALILVVAVVSRLLYGLIPWPVVKEAAKFAILMALSGIGLGTRISELRKTGIKPFVVGLCVASVLAVLSLTLIMGLGLGAG